MTRRAHRRVRGKDADQNPQGSASALKRCSITPRFTFLTAGRPAGDTRRAARVDRQPAGGVAHCHSQRQADRSRQAWPNGWHPAGWSSTGQNPNRAPVRGFDFLGFNVRRYGATLLIKPSAAAIRDPGTAPHRDARTARIQRGGGPRRAHPHHPGVDGLLPGRGVVQDIQIPGQLPVDTHLQMGHTGPPNNRKLGLRTLLREVQQVPERPLGFGDAASGAYLVKFSWTDIVRHIPVTGGASPDDPPWPSTGPLGADASNPRWTATRCACSPGERPLPPLQGRTALRRSATTITPRVELTLHHPKAITPTTSSITEDPAPGENTTRLAHATCQREHQARRRRSTACNPEPSLGLLELLR